MPAGLPLKVVAIHERLTVTSGMLAAAAGSSNNMDLLIT